MSDLKKQIKNSFADVPYPGDTNLRNSSEGDEPFLLEEQFAGQEDWSALPADFIDQAPGGFASALSFFSKEAFRFYLPAYLLADLDGQLVYTDPVFYLTYGLSDATIDLKVNPRRYGAMTWFDYVSDRFAVFTPRQARAIKSYLQFKMQEGDRVCERDGIAQALTNFWEDAV